MTEFSHWYPDLCGEDYYGWKPFELLLPWVIVNQKQYRIPGGIVEISATIKNLEEAEAQVPITSAFNSIWQVQKPDGLWRMTDDYRKLIGVVTPISTAVPDVVSLIQLTTENSMDSDFNCSDRCGVLT